MGAAELIGGIIPIEYIAIRLGYLTFLGQCPCWQELWGPSPSCLPSSWDPVLLLDPIPYSPASWGPFLPAFWDPFPSYSSSWGQLQALIWQHSWGPWQLLRSWDPTPFEPSG